MQNVDMLAHLRTKLNDVEWEIYQVLKHQHEHLLAAYDFLGIPRVVNERHGKTHSSKQIYDEIKAKAEESVSPYWDKHIARLRRKQAGLQNDIARLESKRTRNR